MFRQVSPAPCSPPLGGSDGCSAVRFTPAKSRAGAKTGRPDAQLDVFDTIHAAPTINQSGRGRGDQSSRFYIRIFHAQRATRRYARQTPLPADAPPPTQTPQGQPLLDRGWQQPLNHHKAQPARRVKDAEGTAKPLVLDSVRWLGYLAAVPSISYMRKKSFI